MENTKSGPLPPVSIEIAYPPSGDLGLSQSEVLPDTSLEVLEITVGDVLRAAAADSGDMLALTEGVLDSGARRWTYSELLDAAENAARVLLASFRPGDRIVVWSANRPEWVIAEFGIALAGMTLVTANPALTATEFEYVLQRSQAKAVLVAEGFRGCDLRSVARDAGARVGSAPAILDLDVVLAIGDLSTALPTVLPDSIAQIQFTSGTTGSPKPARLRHRGIANNPRFYTSAAGLRSRGGWISCMPQFHTAGCVSNTIGAVWLRMNNVIVSGFEPELFLALVERERVVGGILVPTMAADLLLVENFESYDITSLEYFGIGAAAVSPDLINRLETALQCRFANTYGQTEASPVVSQTLPDDPIEVISTSIGRPVVQTRVRIVNADGAVVPIGEIGEIIVGGYQVMDGYDGMPSETAETIDADGYLHTGDLARMDSRGYLYLEGRSKDMIIRGGENIYPQEIELRLDGHPGVLRVAVVGLPDDRLGEIVAAVVQPCPGVAVDEAELSAWCRQVMQSIKVPQHWYVMDPLPVLPSGKIPKYSVREQVIGGHVSRLDLA